MSINLQTSVTLGSVTLRSYVQAPLASPMWSLRTLTRVDVGLDDYPGGGVWVELEGVVEGRAHHTKHMARVDIGGAEHGH